MEDIRTALSIQQAQTPTPQRNTQQGYTIWWAYQDHDTLTPKPGPPPYDTNTTALLQAAAAAATQVGALEAWSPQYLVETKVAPHAKAQEKPPAQKPLNPPLKLDTAEHTPTTNGRPTTSFPTPPPARTTPPRSLSPASSPTPHRCMS